MSTNPTSVVLEIPLGTVNSMSLLESEFSVFRGFDPSWLNCDFRSDKKHRPTKSKDSPLTAKVLSLSTEQGEYGGQNLSHMAELLTRFALRSPSNIREVLALGAALPRPEKDKECCYAIYAPRLSERVGDGFIRIRTTPLWRSGYEFHKPRWNGWGITLATLRHEKKSLRDYRWIGFTDA